MQESLGGCNLRSDVCHVPQIALLNLRRFGGGAIAQHGDLIIQRERIIAGRPNAVRRGRACKDQASDAQPPQDQIQPGSKEG